LATIQLRTFSDKSDGPRAGYADEGNFMPLGKSTIFFTFLKIFIANSNFGCTMGLSPHSGLSRGILGSRDARGRGNLRKGFCIFIR
jgi:hypothetical protein